mmetsp:Transcript_12078/g.22605  ORF Transcript_12078/g.22605 Transcript_12078/m.22605 type:complete len:336 (+) Transcript_12078:255-1262(+)
MQVQHNDQGESTPTRSLFRKMREIAIRPRNYTSFHTTVSDSDSYQGGKKEKNEWATSWMSSFNSPVSIEENESERRLREENEALKIRLNAANNTIRDLENVCKKHRNELDGVANQRFCSFLPKSHRDRRGDVCTFDNRSHYSTAVASQASTVQMGSGAAAQKSRSSCCKNQNVTAVDQDDARAAKNFKPSCSNSLLFGPKLRKRLALRGIDTSIGYVSDVTPPCTPERSRRSPNVNKLTKEKAVNVGIEQLDRMSLPKEERHRKLLSFSRLVSKPQRHASKHKDNDRYSYDGSYPIDIFPAAPIYDDTDDSDVERLPVIQEVFANQSNIGERYEI